ncbi:hypothetical protein LXL04_014120 [Taraxacum kok-saghyz]
MGEKSDSKKVSSPYIVLENRPLDQWKVTELKEELKKRKLMTSGLKEVLVKRLDEAVRTEINDAKKNLDDDLNNEAPSDDVTAVPAVVEDPIPSNPLDNKGLEKDINDKDGNEGLVKDNMELDKEKDGNSNVEKEMDDMVKTDDVIMSTQVESVQVVQEISVKTTVITTDEFSGQESQVVGNNGDSKPEKEEADVSNQVNEVSQAIPDSISTDTISNTEKNEPKDNVITDDVKSEVDVKPESSKPEQVDTDDVIPPDDVKSEQDTELKKESPLLTNVVVLDEGKSESVEVHEPIKDKITDESGDMLSSEKLNLDRSSGDDSMEEDVHESKQIDSKFTSNEIIEKSEVKEDVMIVEKTSDSVEVETVTSTKRKPNTAENSEIVKRQRRWNSEGLKVVPEQQSTNNHSAVTTTPKDSIQTPGKRIFSRSDSKIDQESPKERVVPPSLKTPTTSLRIDHFLRPFTLKAVQELLGKTGTVVSFWMDNIKTHCYVTYESVEEAIETRNAICNLQWPVNGGRLLMADFVDPQEVKNRVDPPPPPPPAAIQPPQPSPRLQQHPPSFPTTTQSPRVPIQKQQLPPPPPPVREVAVAVPVAAPPPPPPQVEPPIVTLDDLFRKTRATPRIYYLPLTDEQVAEKMKAVKQSAGRKELFQHWWWSTWSWWFVDQCMTFKERNEFGSETCFCLSGLFDFICYVSYVIQQLYIFITLDCFLRYGLVILWIGLC